MLTKQNNPIITNKQKKDPNPEPTSLVKDAEMKTQHRAAEAGAPCPAGAAAERSSTTTARQRSARTERAALRPARCSRPRVGLPGARPCGAAREPRCPSDKGLLTRVYLGLARIPLQTCLRGAVTYLLLRMFAHLCGTQQLPVGDRPLRSRSKPAT